MTKQEEIEGWLVKELDDWRENIVDAYKATDDSVAVSPRAVARYILLEINKRGVVIKVERELPEGSHPYDAGEKWCMFVKDIQENMLDAGYVAVEPLIEGGKE